MSAFPTNPSEGPAALTDGDVRAKLLAVLGETPVLPVSGSAAIEALKELRLRSIQMAATRLKRGETKNDELLKGTAVFMYILNEIDPLSLALKEQYKFDLALKLVINPIFKFPQPYPELAQEVLDRCEAENWGADAAEDDGEGEGEDDADIPNPVSSNENLPPNNVVAAKPSKADSTSSSSRPIYRVVELPDPSDPIYGTAGIMNGILRIRGPQQTTYQLANTWAHRNAKFFGSGSFIVGQCWPNQIALLRDGAHGMRMGGIAGSTQFGTWSIVVSGAYDELDLDQGDILFYSGSNSHDNKSDRPIVSNGTKALQVSLGNQKPIRVFRTSRAKWVGAPKAGIRYDGLYRITSSATQTNAKGGAYLRFRLARLPGQAPIDVNKPTQAEANLFARVPLGYTRVRGTGRV